MSTKKLILPTIYTAFIVLLLQGCDTIHEETNNQPPPTNKEEVEPTREYSQHSINKIDILVVVNKNDGEDSSTITKIEHYIATANQVFKNSTVPVRLNIVKILPFSFTGKGSVEVLYEIKGNKEIEASRKNTHADIVLAYNKYAQDGLCGISFTNTLLDHNVAHAHITLGCPSTTTAHEVGHIMGLQHSSKKNVAPGHFSYGRGYGVNGSFVTIMSYKSSFNTNIRVHNYSSPELDCLGFECGVPDSEDSVRALKESLPKIVAFR